MKENIERVELPEDIKGSIVNASTKYDLKHIIDFARQESSFKGEMTKASALVSDLKIDGDDHHEFMQNFVRKFNINMDNYLWYFHQNEEGLNIGGLLFKPPSSRVERIDINIDMLLNAANTGVWSINYPQHRLPKYRWDAILNRLILITILLLLIPFILK